MSTAADLVLSDAELQTLTGYKQPGAQLRELKNQGFWRARRSPMTNRVILERSHYDAVTRGDTKKPEPMLRSERMRAKAA